MRSVLLFPLSALAVGAVGCDAGATSDQHDSRGGAGGRGEQSSGGSGGLDYSKPVDFNGYDGLSTLPPRTTGERSVPLARPDCPGVEPLADDTCDSVGLECSYGQSSLWNCRRVYSCDGSWSVRGGCDASPTCEVTPTPGEECSVSGVAHTSACEYENLACYCCTEGRSCIAFPTNRTVCVEPPWDLNCPLVPPNIGEGCDTRAVRCVYGQPCSGFGAVLFCHDQTWEQGGVWLFDVSRAVALVLLLGCGQVTSDPSEGVGVATGGASSGGFAAEGGAGFGGRSSSGGASAGSGGDALAGTGAAGGTSMPADLCPGVSALLANTDCPECQGKVTECFGESSPIFEPQCGSFRSCMQRHCTFFECTGGDCDTDTCGCAELCLPKSEHPCRAVFRALFLCQARLCQSACSSP